MAHRVTHRDTREHAAHPGGTREQVMSVLLRHGPVPATEIGDTLGLSAAGVRRHLDRLMEDGLAETCAPRAVAGAEASRGRPAKHFQLTRQGRAKFGSSYDTLALDAVDLIEELGGEDAVRAFAKNRVEKMFRGAEAVAESEADAESIEDAVDRVVSALEEHGYEPSVHRTRAGIQICQHHCPVSAVAAEHPELCEAEHEVIAELTGRHVQPLALIADGHGICTTHIPLAAPEAAGTNTKGAAEQ